MPSTYAKDREKAIRVAEAVLKENAGKPLDEIKKSLSLAYPFNQGKQSGRGIWKDAIRCVASKMVEAQRKVTR